MDGKSPSKATFPLYLLSVSIRAFATRATIARLVRAMLCWSRYRSARTCVRCASSNPAPLGINAAPIRGRVALAPGIRLGAYEIAATRPKKGGLPKRLSTRAPRSTADRRRCPSPDPKDASRQSVVGRAPHSRRTPEVGIEIAETTVAKYLGRRPASGFIGPVWMVCRASQEPAQA